MPFYSYSSLPTLQVEAQLGHVEIIADSVKNRASKRGCCFIHGLRMQFSPLIRNLSLYKKTTPLNIFDSIKGNVPQKWRSFFYDICHWASDPPVFMDQKAPILLSRKAYNAPPSPLMALSYFFLVFLDFFLKAPVDIK